jgi:hypothetical protein
VTEIEYSQDSGLPYQGHLSLDKLNNKCFYSQNLNRFWWLHARRAPEFASEWYACSGSHANSSVSCFAFFRSWPRPRKTCQM